MVVLLHNIKNIFSVPELRKKLGFTFLVLAVFRLGHHIPLPGIDSGMLLNFMKSATSGFFGYLDLVSGGALRKFAIFALGIGPYISSSIMMQLLTLMIPSLEMLSKEGEYGRKIINQYTRYLTLLLSIIQGFGYAILAESNGLALNPGWGFRLTSILILSTGSLFVMWLGEQISSKGIGNGSSVLIFGSIVAGLPLATLRIITEVRSGLFNPMKALMLVAIVLAVTACVVFLEKGERKIPVHYAKRIIGNKVYGGQSSYIPFKINSSGVIPVIFAASTINMPLMLIGMLSKKFPSLAFIQEWFSPVGIIYNVLTVSLIIFFSFFYTAIIFNPAELAENMKKSGGFIPGIRPGNQTAAFFDYVLTRVGFPGAVYLALLAVIPNILAGVFKFPITHVFSGISMLIIVGVGLDTSAQIESYLIEKNYQGFLASGRLKGRLGR